MFATRRKLHGEEGQGLVEYSLIILMVAVVVVAGLTLFSGALNSVYTTIAAAP
jgi:Flp pilus assembly pilin Flp